MNFSPPPAPKERQQSYFSLFSLLLSSPASSLKSPLNIVLSVLVLHCCESSATSWSALHKANRPAKLSPSQMGAAPGKNSSHTTPVPQSTTKACDLKREADVQSAPPPPPPTQVSGFAPTSTTWLLWDPSPNNCTGKNVAFLKTSMAREGREKSWHQPQTLGALKKPNPSSQGENKMPISGIFPLKMECAVSSG